MKKTVFDLIPEHIRALGAYVPGKPMKQAQRESAHVGDGGVARAFPNPCGNHQRECEPAQQP